MIRKVSKIRRETKQQPSMLPGPAVPGSCLVSFPFPCAIHSVLYLGVNVEALEEHEHEGCGEEEVDEDGDDAARPGVVVERGQQEARVRQDQAHLHVQLDHSAMK